jgi:nitrous oxidase accessory protein NosD
MDKNTCFSPLIQTTPDIMPKGVLEHREVWTKKSQDSPLVYVQKAIIKATYEKATLHVMGFGILVLNGFQFHPIPCR